MSGGIWSWGREYVYMVALALGIIQSEPMKFYNFTKCSVHKCIYPDLYVAITNQMTNESCIVTYFTNDCLVRDIDCGRVFEEDIEKNNCSFLFDGGEMMNGGVDVGVYIAIIGIVGLIGIVIGCLMWFVCEDRGCRRNRSFVRYRLDSHV